MAQKTDGGVEITAGATDPVCLQVRKKNGITPEDLTGITGLTLWIRSKTTKQVESFTAPKVVVDGDSTLGNIKFTPASDDFVNADAGKYNYHFSFTDNQGTEIKVPVNTGQYLFEVFQNHES